MIENSDLLRLQTRVNTLRTALNSLVSNLNGANPNASQRQAIIEAANRLVNDLSVLVRIEEITQTQLRLDIELNEYRG